MRRSSKVFIANLMTMTNIYNTRSSVLSPPCKTVHKKENDNA